MVAYINCIACCDEPLPPNDPCDICGGSGKIYTVTGLNPDWEAEHWRKEAVLWKERHAQARAEARAAALEEAAKLLDLNASQLLLMAGEMTAQELRTVRAALRNRAAAIRALIEESP